MCYQMFNLPRQLLIFFSDKYEREIYHIFFFLTAIAFSAQDALK